MKKLLLALPVVALLGLTTASCSKNNAPECTTFTTSANYNGDNSYTLFLAQLLSVGSPVFQIGIVDQNCEDTYTFSMATEGFGTFPIDDFDNTVTIMKSSLTAPSQSLYMLESGTITITDKGTGTYEFEVDGTDASGTNHTFSTTHSF